MICRRILIVLFTLSSATICGQSKSEKQVGLGTGLTFHASRNELISPFIQKGVGFLPQLFFRSNGKISRHHLQINFSDFTKQSQSAAFKTKVSEGYFQYAYHRWVRTFWEKMNVSGGTVLSAYGTAREDVQKNGLGANNGDGELIATLNLSALIEYGTNKNAVSLQIWTPVASFLAQTGYALSNLETSWLGVSKSSGFDTRLSYQRIFSNRWNGRFDYQLKYANNKTHEQFRFINHQMVFSMVYKFGFK